MHKTLTLIAALGLPQAASAVNVSMSGNLQQGLICSLNTPSAVTFGDVVSTKVNGTNYLKSLNLKATCNQDAGGATSEKLYITATATGSSGNTFPITGAAKGISIALKKGSANQNLGVQYEHVAKKGDNALDLNVVPVLNGAAITAGAFSATITVISDIK